MDKIVIATDGACKGNPGIGGWGAVIIFPNGEKQELCDASEYTTNNIMELSAAINALEYITEKSDIDLITDSTYLKNGITLWIENWEKNGWRTSSKSPVKNCDLWKRLTNIVRFHNVNWIWQKAHVGHELNERADELANIAIKALKEQKKITVF